MTQRVPPVVGKADADAAGKAITDRRTEHDDPALTQLQDHLFGQVNHVVTQWGVPRDALRADVADAWTILDHLQGEIHRLRHRLIRMAVNRDRGAGMTYDNLAPIAGVADRRGVEALARRLESAAAGGPRSERPVNAARRMAREDAAAPPPPPVRPAAAEFLAVVDRHQDLLPDGPDELYSDYRDILDTNPAAKSYPFLVAELARGILNDGLIGEIAAAASTHLTSLR